MHLAGSFSRVVVSCEVETVNHAQTCLWSRCEVLDHLRWVLIQPSDQEVQNACCFYIEALRARNDLDASVRPDFGHRDDNARAGVPPHRGELRDIV